MTRPADVLEILRGALPELARLAGRDRLAEIAARVAAVAGPGADPATGMSAVLVALGQERSHVRRRTDGEAAVLRAAAATGQSGRAVQDLLRRTGSGGVSRADQAALGRWLDASAIEDRMVLQRAEVDQRWELLAAALATLRLDGVDVTHREALRRNAKEVLTDRTTRWPLRVAAAQLLGALVHPTLPDPGVGEVRVALEKVALDAADDPWVQAAALKVVASRVSSRSDPLQAALWPSASTRKHRDHLFARARMMGLCADLERWELLRGLVAAHEASEHVRMAWLCALARSREPEDMAWVVERLGDAAHPDGWRVAGAGAVVLLERACDGDTDCLKLLATALTANPAREVVLVLLDAAWARRTRLRVHCDAFASAWAPVFARWSTAEGAHADTRRLALVLQAWARLAHGPQSAALDALDAWVASSAEGARKRFSSGPVASLTGRALLDVLFVLSHEDLDLSASPIGERGAADVLERAPRRGWTVFLGLEKVRTPWRIWHEATHPRNDKRQAHSHTIDELPPGELIAWSGRMTEVVATEVPGRRVSTPVSVAWDEHLPLPANLLVAAKHRVVHLRTPDSVITLTAERAWAGWRANRRYVSLAGLRTRLGALPRAEAEPVYDDALAEAGFSVTRRASWVGWMGALGAWLSSAAVSDAHATAELTAISIGAFAWWGATKVVREVQTRRWRRALPLVVGGWGSRGKSSVERLKAAMFHGLGYSVLCKSTGCEAMILVGLPGVEATEVFLYRARDKATIVEQQNIMRIASTMGAQVTLYECMALNPIYTQLLQHEWMRDDLTTITNTYPDHEDIQGPSGRDVADVISVFVPTRGRVFTSEQQMTPVVQRKAAANGTAFHACRAEHWDLLPRDLLVRFPDQAYDRNVALVVSVGVGLGIAPDVAIRTMADHVLVDLGAYKRYGPLDVRGARMSFLCGNSANDRASFLSNWDRANLSDYRPESGLTDWLMVVLNNRADRLARQAIFAKITAEDVSAERTVIIGTNVVPMADQIKTAFQKELGPLLREIGHGTDGRAKLFATFRRRLRRDPMNAEQADAVIAKHRPADVDAAVWDPIAAAWREEVLWLKQVEDHDAWSIDEAVDGCVRFLARRIVPFEDSAMSGDQIMARMAEMIPRTSTCLVLGAENIKGTGLDYVYRWVSSERVMGWLAPLKGDDAAHAREALAKLTAYEGWGAYDAQLAAKTLRDVREAGGAIRLGIEEDLETTLASVEAALAGCQAKAAAGSGKTVTAFDRVLALVRSADLIGSVQRRRTADRLYRDLSLHRVGLARANEEAKHLVDGEKH